MSRRSPLVLGWRRSVGARCWPQRNAGMRSTRGRRHGRDLARGPGHAYVGVQAAGHVGTARAPGRASPTTRPGTTGRPSSPSPCATSGAVKVHTCSGSTVNPLSPTMVITSRVTPGIGVRADTSGVLSLDLGVAVDPETAPGRHRPDGHGRADRRLAGTRRRPASAPTSSRARSRSGAGPSTSVTAPCGRSRRPRPRPTGSRRPTRTAPGEFSVTVTARVTGAPTARSSRPTGRRTRRPCPGASTSPTPRPASRGCRSSTSPPVVTVGGEPVGHAARWHDRGGRRDRAHRDLVAARAAVRPLRAPDHRARGVHALGWRRDRAGQDAPRLLPLRGRAPTTRRTGPGRARTGPRRRSGSSGTRRCPGRGSIPSGSMLVLETTYDDGTVRTTRVSGTVSVTVVYSAAASRGGIAHACPPDRLPRHLRRREPRRRRAPTGSPSRGPRSSARPSTSPS